MPLLAIDARCLTNQRNGVGRLATNLLPAIVANASPQAQFCIVRHESNRDPLPYARHAKVKEVFVSSKAAYPPHYFRAGNALRAALSTCGTPDLVFSLFHVLPRGVQSLAPNVVTLLDLIWIDHARESQRNWAEATYMKAFGKHAIGATLRNATHIISISEPTKRAAESHFGQLPISVVPLAVEDAFFQTPSPTNTKPQVVTVSNDKPYKNVRLLLEAFRHEGLADEADLVLVGPEQGLRRLAHQVGVDARTPGFIPDAEYLELLGAAAVFVFPSLVEGFGLPPIEAMASQVPTLVSDVEPMRSICTPGAQTFRPDDPRQLATMIRRLLNDADFHRARSEAASKHAQEFRWARTATDALRVFHEVLGTPV